MPCLACRVVTSASSVAMRWLSWATLACWPSSSIAPIAQVDDDNEDADAEEALDEEAGAAEPASADDADAEESPQERSADADAEDDDEKGS